MPPPTVNERLAALAAGVELLAVVQRADVVDRHLIALLHGLVRGGRRRSAKPRDAGLRAERGGASAAKDLPVRLRTGVTRAIARVAVDRTACIFVLV